MTPTRRLSMALALAAALLAPPLAFAQEPPDEESDLTQTVARVSYLDGNVSYARGDDPDNWQAADRNVPMTLGDRVFTAGDSRAELELHGGDVVRLGSGSDLTALNLTEDTRQFALKSGVAFFRVATLGPNDVFEVDSPNAAVTFERAGEYRIDVDADGNTRVLVHRGNATIAAGGGQVSVGADAGIRIDGLDAPRYEVVGMPGADAWDRWAGERESRVLRAQSRQYVNAVVPGVEDLDEYGRWTQLPEYGWVWSPSSVAVGWAPYRAGRWIWQDPWGWTWVSTEPWGWAPYHSGRWIFASERWCWVPVAPTIRVVHYAPALVAFVGGGPGFSASVTIGGGGFVGWFPLAPRDPLVPWWGDRAPRVTQTQVTNVTYINRTYVTVVNQSTFVSGRPVAGGVITEQTVVRQASAAPVVRGPIPVAPTTASTRVSSRSEATAARPPSTVAARPVVARVAPPPAPPRFDEKLAMIRQNGGAPVHPATSARTAVQAGSRPRAATEVRSAATTDGKVTLSPRGGSTENTPQRVEPIAPSKGGRVLATEAKPVATPSSPETTSRPGTPAAETGRERPERPAAETARPVPRPAPSVDQPDVRLPREGGAPESTRRQFAPPTPRATVPRPAPEAQAAPRADTAAPERKRSDRVPTPPARNRPEPEQHRATAPEGREENPPVAKPLAERPGSGPMPAPTNPRPKETQDGNSKEKPDGNSKEKQNGKTPGRGQTPPARRPTPAPSD